MSVVPSEIESGVQRGDLIAVAVEHHRFAPQELADAPLGVLAPPRMIDARVHVRVEAVFVRRLLLPRVERLPLDEAHFHDRLDVFEAVLPWYREPQRRAVLVWQHLVIESRDE